MKLIAFPDFIALVGADGKNVACFYGALRYVEADLALRDALHTETACRQNPTAP